MPRTIRRWVVAFDNSLTTIFVSVLPNPPVSRLLRDVLRPTRSAS